ncbi:uncharacterized protein EAE98_006202 [Botrytis deweyae]|uniref:Uncharacterized protein n=2 Tax=Botrytis TaxID=33196 RepID=A0A4Z1JV51_9HELO|nr:uncharacterized protein EAE98_006202 [Botrytis deweyae]KAF7908904.1 hypothetical protein EAE99_011613 [Botrytis elliptica]KAF7926817.1 hypothetical protein EAE98_006202 [Botrytis deweyae]TGO73033.1 hypothetical protein BELL_0397g00070 [Botrytis elliptica]
MPFNELQRRDSWPPTIIHLRENNADIDAIDEDPFSYFLTSPDEITDDDIDDFSAGIMSDDEGKSEVREISPSSLQRAPLDDEEDILFGFPMPLSLKDFTKVHGNGRESRAAHRMDQQLKGLGISISDFTTSRGRAKARPTPPQGRGRGQTRSLPLRRPHSWREPSPDLRSIKEEGEDEEGTREGGKMPSMVLSQAVESPKPKKKVHWAL